MLSSSIYCGSIRLMLRFLLALLLVDASVQSAAAFEPQSLIKYGKCEVRTLTNEYLRKYLRKDSKPYAHLACYHFARESPNPYTVSVSISRDTTYPSKGFTISLGAGNQFHLSDEPIPVSIRVDKGPPIIRQAKWSGPDAAYIHDFDPQLADNLLDQIAAGQKLLIKVGARSGVIDLTGSARAVQDFRRRHILLNRHPQTLEAPRNQQ